MLRNKIDYKELSRAKVSDSRNVIISSCSKGGFTMAQQLEAKEGDDKVISVFMKGAFHLEDIESLYNVRDAINIAIKLSEEKMKERPEEWDND